MPLLYLLLFVHYLGRVYKTLWSNEDRNYRCEATVSSVGTSGRYASLIPWRDNYVGVFIRAGYATLLLSGKTTKRRAKDATRWRTTKRRPCVESPITDLPLDDFDWFRGCQILGQLLEKGKKSSHDRSLIVISRHALLLSLRPIFHRCLSLAAFPMQIPISLFSRSSRT